MNRKDFYFRQKVTEAEIDAAFDETENTIDRIFTDLGLVGIAFGLEVAQQVSPNMTVQVSGPGVAYDQTGQRIAIAATQNVNLAVDEAAVSTAVVAPGNSKILSIFAEFDRALSDPRVDGNAVTIYYERAESFRLNVAQGAEAVTPVAPPLRGDQILLADVTITFGTTQVTNAMISTARREFVVSIAGSPHSVAATSFESAIGQVLAVLNGHVAALSDRHAATAIDYAGGGTWADGTTNPAATVAAQLTKIIADLAGTVTTTSGARRIGVEQLTSAWHDATVVTSGGLFSVLNSIVATLANSTVGVSGARKLGIEALISWADGTPNAASSLYTRIAGIVSDLASTTGGASGAAKVGIDAIASWADASAFTASTVRATINKIVADLAASTGTAKVGGAAISSSGLSVAAGTLASQLTALVGIDNDSFMLQATRLGVLHVPTTARYYETIAAAKGIVVAMGGSGQFAYSTNGGYGAWTESSAGANGYTRVRYDATNDLFVAVGASGTIRTAPPASTLTFTSRTSGTANTLGGLFVGGPIRLIAGGDSGTITTSPDGITWTVRTFGSANYAGVLGGTASLAVAGDGTNVRTSTDGITWTSRTLTSGMTVNVVHHNATSGLYIVGGGTSLATAGRIHTSPDGVTWTLRDSASDCILGLANNGNTTVAVGADGLIKYSLDGGINWTAATRPTSAGDHLRSVVYESHRGVFIATGENGTVVKSRDGIKWIYDRFDSGVASGGTYIEAIAADSQVYAVNLNGFGAAWYGTGSNVIGTV